MILARKRIGVTAALLVAALLGLMVVQGYLLEKEWRLEERVFRSSALAAMTATPRMLDAVEIVERVCGIAGDSIRDTLSASVRLLRFNVPFNASGGLASVGDTNGLPPAITCVIAAQGEAGDSLLATPPAGSRSLHALVETERRGLVERVMRQLSRVEDGPATERLDVARIDSLLSANLHAAGIDIRHVFGIARALDRKLVLVSDSAYVDHLNRSELRTPLFPLELVPPLHELVVYFPTAKAHLLREIWPFAASSLLFILVILFAFVQAGRTIAGQHRLGDRIIGFINNMTHEFKTPISTVALASEALVRPEVLADTETVRRYGTMINEENRRMRERVEQILQVAQLERGGLELRPQLLDVHELIRRVSTGFALQAEHRGGTLVCALDAGRPTVKADEVHLAGVISNLLDNALKYSNGPPQVEVRTSDSAEEMVITVSDRGIGIRAEDQHRVFDRYFRCASGNRHDVPGFGLGLSYVKLVVEAHGGRIALQSQPGHGTQVVVRLPVTRGDAYVSA